MTSCVRSGLPAASIWVILAIPVLCAQAAEPPLSPRTTAVSTDERAGGLVNPYVAPPNTEPDELFGPDVDPFDSGRWMLQVIAGPYFSSSLGPGYTPFNVREEPPFNYLPMNVRLGYILNSPCPDRALLHGNGELLLELAAAPVIEGFGHMLGGPSAILRYNFERPEELWFVPYIQAGAGIVFTDAHRDSRQRAIGQETEFLLQAALGIRCIANCSWSLDVEAGFQHISNAGRAERNGGVNAFGGGLGLTYYFFAGCD